MILSLYDFININFTILKFLKNYMRFKYIYIKFSVFGNDYMNMIYVFFQNI